MKYRDKKFISMIQNFITIESIGLSTVRGLPKGTLSNVRSHLGRLKLQNIPMNEQEDYNKWLNNQTCRLKKNVSISWGRSRKILNLFMRDCFYNNYLRKQFMLKKIEKWLEMPLDKIVSNALRKETGGKQIPVWRGLDKLKKSKSEKFQIFAHQYTKKCHFPARIFLDNHLWLKYRKSHPKES